MINNTKSVAEEVDAETEFPVPTHPRPRKRFFNYEAVAELITDPESIKIHFYYLLLLLLTTTTTIITTATATGIIKMCIRDRC